METCKSQIQASHIQVQFDFFESLLSWSYNFLRPISDQNIPISKTPSKDKITQDKDHIPQEHLVLKKNWGTKAPQPKEPMNDIISSQRSGIIKLTLDILKQNPKTRIKEQIKTFPNFIFKTFYKHLRDYEHLYQEKDGVKQLKKYLEDHYGFKYYTLQQLDVLFKNSQVWNSKLNRAVLIHILGRYKYSDIFKNTKRKKKKTFLIMTKVFKMRCKSSILCSRVQCQ